MIKYVCKYTPVELFSGFSQECSLLDEVADNFEVSERASHINLCGFGKALMESTLSEDTQELILINCCDTMNRAYDVIDDTKACDFLFMLDLPHQNSDSAAQELGKRLLRLKNEYAASSGIPFDKEAFLNAFAPTAPSESEPYVGILGVRVGKQLEETISSLMPLPVRNLTCVSNREFTCDTKAMADMSEEDMFTAYAVALLSQFPCGRMGMPEIRCKLFDDKNLKGIIYHSIKFCDYYEFEYVGFKRDTTLPILKLETDYTRQSEGQLRTRIQAFAETLSGAADTNQVVAKVPTPANTSYVAGIDSGSASTDVVIMDTAENIISTVIAPTGGGANNSAEQALSDALSKAALSRSDIRVIVKTGYGRDYIADGDDSVTEITCHAAGAHFLSAQARTVIDIGGQDSKVIRIDETGAVQNFVMNDKCAAGTGRFLEMMARALGLTLEQISEIGLDWEEDITISSMCTVFAESEVVSLVAQNKALEDIVHGLNSSVASKVG
ncbi:MAG: 2-hydroxyglutaryl-CoA dehydratase, partial [Clostridia bacterium]|nr:2-hydroxyglutaryl-CoA dehydratase [Clostridia bacterium]